MMVNSSNLIEQQLFPAAEFEAFYFTAFIEA